MAETGWVINPADSPERMESAGAELEGGGFAVARVDACDGRGRSPDDFDGYDDALARRFMGRSLTPGELGCHESHMRALTAFLDSGDDIALVLEDDFRFAEGGAEAAETVIAWMRQNPRWHAVNIGAHRRKITTPLAELAGRELVRAHYFPMLAHAMVWSRPGAEALLGQRHPVFCPADNMYRHVLTRSGAWRCIHRRRRRTPSTATSRRGRAGRAESGGERRSMAGAGRNGSGRKSWSPCGTKGPRGHDRRFREVSKRG